MPIAVKLKSTRLTHDQHRVEVRVVDAPPASRLRLHAEASSEPPPPPEGPAAASGAGSVGFDVRIAWQAEELEASGFSVAPDEVRLGRGETGRKEIVWRRIRLGDRRTFLVRRTRPGAYTVDLVAEVEIRIAADAAGTTVTFPPTP